MCVNVAHESQHKYLLPHTHTHVRTPQRVLAQRSLSTATAVLLSRNVPLPYITFTWMICCLWCDWNGGCCAKIAPSKPCDSRFPVPRPFSEDEEAAFVLILCFRLCPPAVSTPEICSFRSRTLKTSVCTENTVPRASYCCVQRCFCVFGSAFPNTQVMGYKILYN